MLNPTGGLKFGERNYRGALLRGSSANPSAIVRGPCGRVVGVAGVVGVVVWPCGRCGLVWSCGRCLSSGRCGRCGRCVRLVGVSFAWSVCLSCRLCLSCGRCGGVAGVVVVVCSWGRLGCVIVSVCRVAGASRLADVARVAGCRRVGGCATAWSACPSCDSECRAGWPDRVIGCLAEALDT